MKKYLFIVPSLAYGGAERAVANFASELVGHNREVTVVIYFNTDNEYEIDGRVKLINLSRGNEAAYNSIGYLKKIMLLRKIIKSEKPDYILPFLPQVTVHASLAAFDERDKLIHTVRNNPRLSPGSGKMRKVRDFLIIHSKKTIVQNTEQRDYFPERIHNKLYVLKNILPDDAFNVEHKGTGDGYLITAAGRLIEQKNYPMLIRAIKTVIKKHPDAVLRIYGSGDLEPELKECVKSTGVENNVFLMGRSNDIKGVYSGTDLYILSSDFEGMPNALMEAMAAGLPCISTDCPTGPKDIIEPHKTGLLVPVGDAAAMSDAICYMYENRDKAREMGVCAKEKIKEVCGAERIINELMGICEN